MALETMTKLATTTLSGSQSSVTFSNIPQGYTDLKLEFSIRTDKAAVNENVFLSFNGSTSNFSAVWMFGGGGSGVGSSTTARIAGFGTGANATASVFGVSTLYIAGYSDNRYKTYSSEASLATAGTTAYQGNIAGLWSNSAPITSITLTPENGPNFVANSTFTLYGIKNARQTAGNSIKATGGNIVFDGTYVTHTFTSSGTFTPTQPLLVDYLVVAGGGSGGSGFGTGGGGGGGLRSTVTATGGGGALESPLSLLAQAYTVTIGAGGVAPNVVHIGASTTNNNGNPGSESTFSTITATGGGYGGGYDAGTKNGGNGGSGGGGGRSGSVAGTGGTGTANQGYSGGTAHASSGEGGGGGGAGAAGGNASGTVAGAGGAGVTTSISGASVTYAGGGGGGAETGTPGSGGSGGGGAGTTTPTGNNGSANTGGGGSGTGQGSSSPYATGGNGGSGIVIIRYRG